MTRFSTDIAKTYMGISFKTPPTRELKATSMSIYGRTNCASDNSCEVLSPCKNMEETFLD